MASRQSSATPVPAHNGGKSYQYYNTDTNQFETRTPIVQQPSNTSSHSNTSSSRNTPRNGGSKQNDLVDYIDRMIGVGMGGNGGGAGSSPSTTRKAVTGFPTAMPADLRGPKPEEGSREAEEALSRGLSWEHIAAGAAGAAAALFAQRTLSRLNQANGPSSGASGSGTSPNNPGGQPNNGGNRSGNILTRNGLVEGQPSNHPDIDAQFYEIFGLPTPQRSGMEPRLTQGSPAAGSGTTRETFVPPYQSQSSLPGPRQTTKQLGDMDSPTYRENFGYNDLDRQAQEIVDKMEMYGDYNIEKFMDPAAQPAVAARVGALLRGMM